MLPLLFVEHCVSCTKYSPELFTQTIKGGQSRPLACGSPYLIVSYIHSCFLTPTPVPLNYNQNPLLLVLVTDLSQASGHTNSTFAYYLKGNHCHLAKSEARQPYPHLL